ncbi:MAG: prepilin-type N-terminal cleavage/methylation domain-containing protein [Betaproteobacteria bacterium]|nr:prepilin-type N-terminal cleavage/methylation domain-containing protein [Betaproteobacteria bacterium]
MKPERGFSLIELMVAMGVGLLIVLALAVVIERTSGNQRELALANRQLENGRFAMQSISEDLHNAGYLGAVGTMPVATALPNVCETTPANWVNYSASNGIGAFPLAARPTCIPASDHVAGTDILAVIHASSVVTLVGSLVAGRPYVQTDTTSIRLAAAAGNATTDAATFNLLKKDGLTRADIRQLQVYVYFVSPCNRPAAGQSVCTAAADDGQPVPTLKRMALLGNALSFQPIAEGIENMQVEVGLDTDNDGTPDSYSTTATTVADMNNAMAIGVHILARNTERTNGYTDTKSYQLGSVTVGAASDAFRRHVFSRTVRLHNQSSRRAS